MDNLTLKADARTEFGSAASRRFRRAGYVPVLLSGPGEEPLPLTISEHQFFKAHRAGAQLLTLDIGENQVEALVREIQWDPMGERLLHIDFDRVKRGQILEIEIPIEYFGEAVGVAAGGVFQKRHDQILVACRPSAIPEKLEADIRELEIGGDIRVKDLDFPEGVEPRLEAETILAVLSAPVIEEELEEGEDASAEPKVIGKEDEKEEGED